MLIEEDASCVTELAVCIYFPSLPGWISRAPQLPPLTLLITPAGLFELGDARCQGIRAIDGRDDQRRPGRGGLLGIGSDE